MGASAAARRFAVLAPADVAPDRLELWLPGLAPSVIERLLASDRLGPRLTALLAADHALPALPPDALATGLARLALLSGADLEQIGLLAAAVLHGARIRRMVRREDRASLAAALGGDVLRHVQDLAALAAPLPSPMPGSGPGGDGAAPGPAELVQLIHNSGPACLAAWLAGLPDGVQERARLKLGPLPEAAPPPFDPALIRAVLERLAADYAPPDTEP